MKDITVTLTPAEWKATMFALLNAFHWKPDGSGDTTNPAAKSAFDKLDKLKPKAEER